MRRALRRVCYSIISLPLLFLFVVAPVAAAPANPFIEASPGLPTSPDAPSGGEAGDWGVAEQRGAAIYTIPLVLPPGRNGMAPSLALRYSSGSLLRGSLAAGWTLDLPHIAADRSPGYEGGATFYRASLGAASGRLVEVPDTTPFPGTTAFRTQIDGSFTRFFRRGGGVAVSWVALTTDGTRHYFDRELGASDGTSIWYITRQVDPFGNMVRYRWEPVRWPQPADGGQVIDLRLSSIEYGANEAAGLQAHARVLFAYAPLDLCHDPQKGVAAKPQAPMGAQREPGWRISGASRLETIRSEVRDEPGLGWRPSREVALTYRLRSSTLYEDPGVILPPDAGPAALLSCKQAPLRYLTRIDVAAFTPDGTKTSMPPTTFSYNDRAKGPFLPADPGIPRPRPDRTIDSPGYPQRGDTLFGDTSSLLDVDGDGLRDLVAVRAVGEVCTLFWRRGLYGGSFAGEERSSALPTFRWYYQTDPQQNASGLAGGERCTFGGQWVVREGVSNPEWSPRPVQGPRPPVLFAYRFVDFTGDGRLDLLVGPATTCQAPEDHFPETLPEPRGNICGWDGQNRFSWWLFRNAIEFPLDVVFEGQPTLFSMQARGIGAPAPLTGGGSEVELSDRVDIRGMPPGLIDLDGDGFLDAVTIGGVGQSAGFGCEPPADPDPHWCVYFGRGGALSPQGYEWPAPDTPAATIGVSGFRKTDAQRVGASTRYDQRTWSFAGLYDIDGDGLPDLVEQQSLSDGNGSLRAFRNYGAGFSRTPIDLGQSGFADELQSIYRDVVGSALAEGERGYRRRLVDLDGDGLLDLLSFVDRSPADASNIARDHRVRVAFNAGDRFLPAVTLPDEWNIAKRLLIARLRDESGTRTGDWWVQRDFFDATGDGLADLVSYAPGGGSSVTIVERPGLTAAPDLLRAVDNGRGMRISFRYGSSSDDTLVARGDRSLLNGPRWLVSEMRVAATSAEEITRYSYADPHTSSTTAITGIPEPARFRGFDWVGRTTFIDDTTPARRVATTFSYQADPDGRPTEVWTYRAEDPRFVPHRYEANVWARKPLFLGQANFVHLASTTTRICAPSTTAVACASATDLMRRAHWRWIPAAPSKERGDVIINPDQPPPPPELYLLAEQREGAGPAEAAGDLRSTFMYQVRYGQDGYAADDYRVLPFGSERAEALEQGDALTYVPFARSATRYNAAGLPVEVTTWLDETTSATVKNRFDPQTGNLLATTKPVQSAPGGSGAETVLTYDPHRLFVRSAVNELLHEVQTFYDVATGALLERRGPNYKVLPAGGRDWQREVWTIDGFGRLLSQAVAFDDGGGYKMHPVARFSYFDAEQPVRVREERLRDIGGNTWLTTERTLDGRGRPLSKTQIYSEGGAERRATTSYGYNSLGALASVTLPDPRDDAKTVVYSYSYDGLGRITNLTRPDGNGSTISYGALSETHREDAADGSGGARTKLFDVFGRLVELREGPPSGPPLAITRYSYDAADNLSRVVDADGAATELHHDWGGRRVEVRRAERSWRYAYDLNGNLLSERRPGVAADASPDVAHQYDALDRVIETTYRDPQVDRLPAVAPQLPYQVYLPLVGGAPAPAPVTATVPAQQSQQSRIIYTYDQGPNGVGRVSEVALPFGGVRYGYEARGLVTREERIFALSGVAEASASQRVERDYNALGALTESRWDDGQRWRIGYDGRGLSDTVEWYDPAVQSWRAVADYERLLAGLPAERLSAFGQSRTYHYDELGRPAGESMRAGGQIVAERGYRYSDSGDLLEVTGRTGELAAGAGYQYDALHRLVAADGPHGYRGRFSYSPAGNIVAAAVTWDGSPETRDVTYRYGAADPQAVSQLIDQAGGEYAGFDYDAAGNMTLRRTRAGFSAYQWDGQGQLRVARTPEGAEVYFYDHAGQRMLAVSASSGVRFWFAERETHYDLRGVQARIYLHLSAGGPTLARVTDGASIELQYADALHNLMFALDGARRRVASFLYGAFGEVVREEGGDEHRRQFNGKEHDQLTGLRNYGFRSYDPLALRWISADPLYQFLPDLGLGEPQRQNLYSFSLNNPVRYYDPDGRDVWTEDQQVSSSRFGVPNNPGSPGGGPYCAPGGAPVYLCNSGSSGSGDDNDTGGEQLTPKLGAKGAAEVKNASERSKSSGVNIGAELALLKETVDGYLGTTKFALTAAAGRVSAETEITSDNISVSATAEWASIEGCATECVPIPASDYDTCVEVCIGGSVGVGAEVSVSSKPKLALKSGVSASVSAYVRRRPQPQILADDPDPPNGPRLSHIRMPGYESPLMIPR